VLLRREFLGLNPPMADDHFAVLGLERRAALEADAIKARFQERGRALHPDTGGGDAPAFVALNQAQSVLSRPSARLRHLIELTWGGEAVAALRGGAMSSALMDRFAEVGAVLARADAYVAKKAKARSALARALLAGEELEVNQALLATGGTLMRLRKEIESSLPELDRIIEGGAGECETVAACRDLSYAEKWQAQLQERMAALI